MKQELIELLQDFEEGDLVATATIIESAERIAEADAEDIDERTRTVATEIAARFRTIASTGDADGIEADRERWIEELSSSDGADVVEETTSPLAFLESAVGHLSAIVDMLKRYEDGDLKLATEILAETQQLAIADTTPDEALPFVRSIRDRFFEYVRAGTEQAEPDPEPHPHPATISLDEPEEDDPAPSAVSPTQPAETPEMPTQAPPHEVPIDDIDVVTSFIQESVDHLDDIEHRVLNLEDEFNEDLVNSIFRSIHTIKGVASFVGFSYVSETSHDLETLLDDVRNGVQGITEELVTVILDGTDVLAKIVHSIERQVAAAGDRAPESVIEESFDHLRIVARVRALRGIAEPTPTTSEQVGTDPADTAPSTSADDGPAKVDLRDAPVVTREMINAFIEESSDLVDQVEQQLLSAETAPIRHETVDEIFRSIHTIKGNAGFFWFTRVEQRCMAMEGALDEFRTEGSSLDSDAAASFIDMLDTVRESIRSVAEAAESTDEGRLAEQRSSSDVEQEPSSAALGEILVEMGEISEDSLERALSSQQRRLGEILVSEEHVKPDSVQKALDEQAKRRSDAPSGSTEYSSARKDIRVDTTKLDKLFDLVGELITAESMVLGGISSNGSNGSDHSGNGSASVAKAASYLQKITREMQEITLSIRMIPLEATFGKMRRLVRDLARRFEKNVSIEISGEQTEMDKNVIEEVSDPLVHIIRNAIDHGIESASDREAAGKPKTGTIRLSAKHEGNEIWITIEDDGKGLNRDRILAKAIDRGLVQDPEVELSDEQIYRFIFEPAFSTADTVSEISGRGVGMDVVRQNIEKLRGKIDLRSEPGSGTTFVLRIPLTLAILDGVTFDIGGTHYSVPTTDLVTFQSYDPEGISRTSADHHGFRLRDEVIPIIQYEHRESVPEHGVVIVLQSNGRRAAIVVDRIVGYRQFVVRAMPGYIQSMRAVSGCSIQGDGSISFIIDVGDLLEQELESVGSR